LKGGEEALASASFAGQINERRQIMEPRIKITSTNPNLTPAVVAINGWNRLNIAFRTVPGTYQPAQREQYLMAA
jgi:hypothetical protein